jgi:SAM-dependent methyltransferase
MTADAQFNQYARNYDAVLNGALSATGEDKGYFARGRVNWFSQCLRKLEIGPARVLDYGCGTGSTEPLLLQALDCASVIGIDPSEDSVREAQGLHPSQRITFLPLARYKPTADCDAAYCNGVFHHIAPAQRISSLRLVFDSLRPGGVFAFWENNPWNLGTRYVMSRCPFDHDAVTISPPEARTLARDAGFEVLRVDHLFFFPGFLGWLRGLEPALRRFPFGGQFQVLCRRPL